MKFYTKMQLVMLALALLGSAGWTEEKNGAEEQKAVDEIIETTHSVLIQGVTVSYRARTGTMVMKKEDGSPRAKLFFIAYEKEDESTQAKRPITFAFNGGPGASSVWLHLGVFGPKRVDLDEDGYPTSLPFDLVDNDCSILDQTDLVFIDPISTGYSRVVEETNPSEFHGIREDIESVGEFIRLYTTRYQRWASPKFLAGESYGTTRASGLSNYLLDRHGLYLDGIILVSAILDFQTILFHAGNDLPHILYLPSYTASAWYHQRLEADLQTKPLEEVVQEARVFALGEYASALLQGSRLPNATRHTVATRLARLTGLDAEYIERSQLRIENSRFGKELLREAGRTLGRFDSRYKGIDRDDAGEGAEYDPSFNVVQGAYTAAFNAYVRAELQYVTDLPYEILTGRVHPWNWGNYINRYVNVAEDLRQAMVKNPYMQILVQCGYYDMATPFLAAEHTFDHMLIHPTIQDHVRFEYYDAGHMMYLHKPSLRKMKADLDRFLQQAVETSQNPVLRY
ncbi:MAG: peptidase S10 [bacterium]|nr:peptidase S10 [bacterium]